MKKQLLKAVCLLLSVSLLCSCSVQENTSSLSSVPETSSKVGSSAEEATSSNPETSNIETDSTSEVETDKNSEVETAATDSTTTTATQKPETTTGTTTTTTNEQEITLTPDKEITLNIDSDEQYKLLESGSGVFAASMVLKYYGIDVDIDELYNSLDMVDVNREDITPWEYCMGTPKTMTALYYAPVVKNMINTYLSKNGITNLTAKDITGCEPDELYNHVLNGNPVIVLAHKIMRNYTDDGVSWILPNGEEFVWKIDSNYWVLNGINSTEVKLINARTGNERNVLKEKFEESFNLYYSQAIIIE